MYSSLSELDRNIARSFLNAPTNSISYRPMLMRRKENDQLMIPSQSDEFIPQPHPNAQLGYPMYYDVIIDTVTDYDSKKMSFDFLYHYYFLVFYPIAKQTKKYFHNSNDDQEDSSPRYQVQRLDELAVSIDFPYDQDSTTNWSNEHLQPMKNVRFNDSPTWIPYSNKQMRNPPEQYCFQPESIPNVDNQQSSVRYITTPFFWFRPVLNHNYAICIPATGPSLHAYITSRFISSTPNPVRL